MRPDPTTFWCFWGTTFYLGPKGQNVRIVSNRVGVGDLDSVANFFTTRVFPVLGTLLRVLSRDGGIEGGACR